MYHASTSLPQIDTWVSGEAVMAPKILSVSQIWQDMMTGSALKWEKYTKEHTVLEKKHTNFYYLK